MHPIFGGVFLLSYLYGNQKCTFYFSEQQRNPKIWERVGKTKKLKQMKKVVLCMMALVCAVSVSAQTAEEMQASKERAAKLEKLVQPKNCGIATVDGLTSAAGLVAVESIQITPLLQGLYYRSIGQTEDGVTDVTVKKPTLEELTELSARIGTQAAAVAAATKLVPAAGEELKGVKNPMKLAAATKSVKYSKDVLEIVGVESAFQVKAIADMIKTATSNDNL